MTGSTHLTHLETSWASPESNGCECFKTTHPSVAKRIHSGFSCSARGTFTSITLSPLPHEGRELCNPLGNPRKVPSMRPLGHFGRALKAGVSLGHCWAAEIITSLAADAFKEMQEKWVKVWKRLCEVHNIPFIVRDLLQHEFFPLCL